MTNLLTTFVLLLCLAMLGLGVQFVLRRRARDQRRAAARARRVEQDRIWHERMRERAPAEVD